MIAKKDRAYVRVSTKYESQKDSPEHQDSFIRETAAKEGVEIDHVYEDRDTATSIMERDDVQRMIQDAKRGEIRSIWFASLSRFSRDALDAISLKRTLVNALKIRVVSIEDGYDSAKKDDELLFGIKTYVNQNTSGDISTSSRRGLRQSALEKGNFIGSKPAYGYMKVMDGRRKTLDRNEEQARVVELIYGLYIDHAMGDKAIVNYLNGDNPQHVRYPTYTGGPWTLSSIQRILTNPIYTGYNVHGKHTVEVAYDDLSNLMNRRKKLVQRPRDKWEFSKEPTHPAIIPKDRFNLAQELRLLRGGGTRGGRRAFVNVFAKFIFCKHCGSAMVCMASKQSERYRYLMCSRRRRAGEAGCENGKWVPYYEMRDELIGGILERVAAQLKDLEKHGVQAISSTYQASDFEKEKRKHEKRIEDNRKLLFEIRRQNMLGELDKDQYEFEKGQYEKEIMESEGRLTLIKAEEKKSLDTAKLIKDAKRSLGELTKLKNYDDVEKTRTLLLQVVKRIDVDVEGEVDVQTYI